jgi:signal transduction histidine kinase
MTVITLLLLTSYAVGEAMPSSSTALRVTGVAALGAYVASSYTPTFTRHLAVFGLALVYSMAALAAAGAYLRANVAILGIMQAILLLLASAILPWGIRMQWAVVFPCMVLLGATAWWIGPFEPHDPNLPVFVDAAAAFALSLFVASATRTAFDNAAAENHRLQAAEARIRSLADALEAKVHARTAELEAALSDQRSLARAISHDLRQPLRHIDGFTRMLAEDAGERLDATEHDHIDHVRMATARMGHMVDALLELTRVAGEPIERKPVDLSALARDIGESLAERETGRKVTLEVEDGLRAVGDPALVRNMLRELMANAWKFTRGRDPALVHVGRDNGAMFVRDDGHGFDMRHASRLFGTFERLHHTDEFEGEGVGLALAQRIARRHGGRVWAESEPGRGATFYFTLSPDGARDAEA